MKATVVSAVVSAVFIAQTVLVMLIGLRDLAAILCLCALLFALPAIRVVCRNTIARRASPLQPTLYSRSQWYARSKRELQEFEARLNRRVRALRTTRTTRRAQTPSYHPYDSDSHYMRR